MKNAYRKLSLRGKLRYWKAKLRLRAKRLDKKQDKRKELQGLGRKASSRIRALEKQLGGPSTGGVKFVASFEGYYKHLYNDPVGYATIGYGHLVAYKPVEKLSEKERAPWAKGITKTKALDLLREDLAGATDAVRENTKVWKDLNQNQRDALISFTFNCGAGAYAGSTLLKRLNAKDYLGAADEFLRWTKAGDPPRDLPGLVRRRKEERALFLKPVRKARRTKKKG